MADGTVDAPAADAAAPPAPSPSDGSDLEALLAEFERTAMPPADSGKPASASDAPSGTETAGDAPHPPDGAAAGRDADLSALAEWALGIERDRLQAREDADADAAIARAREAVSEYPGLPADYADRYLRSEYEMNAELRAAWDGRHDSPAAAERCERAINRTIQALVKSAKSIPDPVVTADAMAVAHAVRGTTTKPPPAAPPNLSRMSSGEFNAYVEREFGYRPGV